MTGYVLGLGLGLGSDHTALAILKCSAMPVGPGVPERTGRGRPPCRYDAVLLDRFPPRTPFPAVVETVKATLAKPELAPAGPTGRRPRLVIDATGTGRGMVDPFLDARIGAEVVPATITAGESARWDDWPGKPARAAWVPKKELATAVRLLMDENRLRIVPGLHFAKTLETELREFKVKVTLGANDMAGPWREKPHDDLVLAVALAAWLGEYGPTAAGTPRVGFTQYIQGPPVFVPGGGPTTVGRAGPSVYVPRSGGPFP